MNDWRVIHSEKEYERACDRFEELAILNPKRKSPEGEERQLLRVLIKAYEDEHHVVEAPDPISYLEFLIDQGRLTRKDLQPLIGERGRVSDIMTRKRDLSINMIRKLHAALSIPADVLIQPSKRTTRSKTKVA